MFTKEQLVAGIRSIEGQPITGQIMRIEACVREVEALYAELARVSKRGHSRASTWRQVSSETRNGVQVKTTRTDEGTVVEADCNCYGLPNRSHSTMKCPALLARLTAVEAERELRRGDFL